MYPREISRDERNFYGKSTSYTYGFTMTLNEAILLMAVGFMIIVGIWLTALTYLVLGRSKKQKKLEDNEESHDDESTD